MPAPTRTAPRRTAPKRMALGGLLVAGALCLSACGQGEQETGSEPGIAKQATPRSTESATDRADTADSPRDSAAQDEAAQADDQSDAAKAAEDGGPAVVGDLQRELDRIAANYGNVGIAVSDGTTTMPPGAPRPKPHGRPPRCRCSSPPIAQGSSAPTW
ncbi:hypothetical protein HMPREF1261_02030 [Corynebacterium sp. KPL1818]|uniref:hypothetical protein n=1 Tax=Corynebacterium sp. KPL1818 TaxID=1203559 RepID=UPI0003B8925A|nr:hypothetical protein [Corynebacterium sp. KPL1818]ERS57974.1 hypothetical protein HMPREF1261_02030 [Corynebacterium sp. KPL1818]